MSHCQLPYCWATSVSDTAPTQATHVSLPTHLLLSYKCQWYSTHTGNPCLTANSLTVELLVSVIQHPHRQPMSHCQLPYCWATSVSDTAPTQVTHVSLPTHLLLSYKCQWYNTHTGNPCLTANSLTVELQVSVIQHPHRQPMSHCQLTYCWATSVSDTAPTQVTHVSLPTHLLLSYKCQWYNTHTGNPCLTANSLTVELLVSVIQHPHRQPMSHCQLTYCWATSVSDTAPTQATHVSLPTHLLLSYKCQWYSIHTGNPCLTANSLTVELQVSVIQHPHRQPKSHCQLPYCWATSVSDTAPTQVTHVSLPTPLLFSYKCQWYSTHTGNPCLTANSLTVELLVLVLQHPHR